MPTPNPMKDLQRMPAPASDYDVFCGIDWGEVVNAFCLVDRDAKVLAEGTVPDTFEGLTTILAALDEHSPAGPVAIGLETDSGLLVDALRRSRHVLMPVNPLRIKAFRNVRTGARNKSDKADAKLIAFFVRTMHHDLRPMPRSADTARGLRQLGRAHSDIERQLTRTGNKLRAVLRQYFPALITAFPDKQSRSLRLCAFLSAASTPEQAKALTVEQITSIFDTVPATRGNAKRAAAVREALHSDHLEAADAATVRAFAATARALALSLAGLIRSKQELEDAMEVEMTDTAVGAIQTAVTGMGAVLAARVFGEIGNLDRYSDLRHLRGYAGTAPDARSSGISQNAVTQRKACNRRLKNAMFQLANAAYLYSEGAHAYVEAQKATGKRHNACIRKASNRMLGGLARCLRTGELWSDQLMWGTAERRVNLAHRKAALAVDHSLDPEESSSALQPTVPDDIALVG